MKSGKCPKCSSSEIYRGRGHNQRSAINLGMFKHARLEDYVCAACGLTESYISDRAKLDVIKKSWSRVAALQR
jgi:hypothetical protein